VSSLAIFGIEVSLDSDDDDAPSTQRVVTRPVDETLEIVVDDGRFAAARAPIDSLSDGETRLVAITGAEDGAELRAVQCAADARRCGRALPIRADDRGRAGFLFEFAATIADAPDGDCVRASCVLLVVDDDGDTVVSTPLVFDEQRTVGSMRIDQRSQLQPDQAIDVHLEGFAPGALVVVSFCTPPGPVDASRCGSPAPEVPVTIDASGRADVTIAAHVGDVGSNEGRCRRGDECAIAIIGHPEVAVTRISFAGSADAQPGRTQVIAGLLVAAVLMIVAAILIRRGPWTPPGGDPFEGVTIDDPFAGMELDTTDDPWTHDQPATSRRENESAPTVTTTAM
jgi:hypothetical protein